MKKIKDNNIRSLLRMLRLCRSSMTSRIFSSSACRKRRTLVEEAYKQAVGE